MEIPSQEQFSRIFAHVESIDELPASQVPQAISQLRAKGESEAVLSYLSLNYSLPSPPEFELKPGDRIADHYTIRAKIGAGGMGIVYRATQDRTERDVALKLIHPRLHTRMLVERFDKEIITLGKLDHPGIVHLFDADTHEGTIFFTMQLLDGEPLHRFLRSASLTLVKKIVLVVSLCDAVQAAHDRGIIHRDLKPANILIDRSSGNPVVLDFGLATLAGQLLAAEDEQISGLSGTPEYMSPEQFLGTAGEFGVGQSIDVYALGVIAFEILSGHSPYQFPDDSSWAAKRRVVLETSPSHLDDLPDLDRAVRKAIRKDPADRYFTASGFAKALRRIQRKFASPEEADTPKWQPAADAVVPSTEWVLEKSIGEGGIGQVWLANHPKVAEQRVFKFCDDPEKVRSLKREASLFRLLKEKIGQHPNIVRLHDVSLDDPPFFIAMDHIAGGDLVAWSKIQGGIASVPTETKIDIVAQAATTLQSAHDAGILHRDIKPGNLLIEDRESSGLKVYLGDFGIGQLLGDEELANTRLGFTKTIVSNDTNSGSGTHSYMAPEVQSGQPATVRSDIYSLGVVLYQALAGDFSQTVTIDWYEKIEDSLLEDDLKNCFSGNPNERFSSAGQLASRLGTLRERRAEAARSLEKLHALERKAYRRGLLRAGLAAAVVLGIVSFLAVLAIRQSKKAREASIVAEFEQAAALRSSTQSGRGFQSVELLRGVSRRSPSSKRIVDDLVASYSIFDIRPSPPSEMLAAIGSSQFRSLAPTFRHAVSAASGRHPLQFLFDGEHRDVGERPSQGSIRLVKIGSTGDICAVVDKDGKVVLHTLPPIAIEPVEIISNLRIVHIEFSPDDSMVALADENGRFQVYDSSGEPLSRVLFSDRFPESRGVDTLRFRPGSTELAISSASSLYVLVWDWKNGELSSSLRHSLPVRGINWKPDGSQLAAASENGYVYLWEMNLDEPAASRHAIHELPPTDVAFTQRGDLLVSTGLDNTLRVWDPASGDQVVSDFPEGVDGKIVISNDDLKVALVPPSGRIPTWEIEPGAIYQKQQLSAGQNSSYGMLDFSADGRLLLATLSSGVYVVDVPYNRNLGKLPAQFAVGAGFALGDKSVVASSSNGAHRWRLDFADTENEIRIGSCENFETPDGLGEMAIADDGRSSAFIYQFGAYVVEHLSGSVVYLQAGFLPGAIAVSENGRYVALGDVSGESVAVFDVEADGGSPIDIVSACPPFAFRSGKAISLVFLDHGHLMIQPILENRSPEPGLDLELPGVSSGAELAYCQGSDIVAVSSGSHVSVVDLGSGKRVAGLQAGRVPVVDLELSDSGEQLAAITQDGVLHLWQIGDITAILDSPPMRRGLPSRISLEIEISSTEDVRQRLLGQAFSIRERLRKNPLSWDDQFSLGKVYQDLGKLEEAEQLFMKCLELNAGKKATVPKDVKLAHSWSILLISDPQRCWDPELASKMADVCLKADPGNITSRLTKAFSLYQLGDYVQSLAEVDRSLAVGRGSAQAVRHLCRAGCLFRLERPLEAEPVYALGEAQWAGMPENLRNRPSYSSLREDVRELSKKYTVEAVADDQKPD